MGKSLLFFLLSLLWFATDAQNTNIGDQINQYSHVSATEYCGNRIIVDSPSLFTVNSTVLLIQMQGVTIDVSNSSSYGNILNYNDCGNYEFQTIDSIIGDTIKFRYEIERLYNPAGIVQLVSVPAYPTATVTSILTCQPWNGSTGGILVLKADSLILNDTIDVSGRGFRGFYVNDSSQQCLGNYLAYNATDSIGGGIKGEGVAQFPYIYGRGKNANGGGGGNNQNTGGGGGGNFAKGGAGGQIVYRTFACQGYGPGDGGGTLKYTDSLNRVFMGGGGGCGHGNNSENTGGENGGGICMLSAGTLISNNQAIHANGNDQSRTAGSDGAGGGGAGGTVLLSVSQYIGNLSVSAHGGAGGNLDNDFLTRSCMGPGGGGGGGVLWLSQASRPANVTFTAPGGVNGMNLGTGSTFCPYGVTNGALPGDTGGIVTGLILPVSITPYIRLSATVSHDTLLCNDQQIRLTASGTSSDPISYLWSTGQQGSSISFLATQTDSFSVSVTDDNTCTVVKTVHVTVDLVNPQFSGDTSFCSSGHTLTLSALNPGSTIVSYDWSTGATTPTITFIADTTKTYTVTVTSVHGCVDSATMHVTVGDLGVTYSPDVTVCPGVPTTLAVTVTSGTGVTYSWNTGDTTSSITVADSITTTYQVIVRTGACSETHSFTVTKDYLAAFISPDTTICPNGTANLSVSVPGAPNITYLWSTGATSQQIQTTTASTEVYSVTVSSSNHCTGTAAVSVYVDSVKVNTSPLGNDTTICPSSRATLSTSVLAVGHNNIYRWNNGQSTQAISVSPASSQTYSVTVTDSLGCSGSASILVNISNSASHNTIQITATPDSSAAPGDTIMLAVTGDHLATFHWTPGGALSDSSIQSPIATPQKSTDYCVQVTDSNNCMDTVCKNIPVGGPPADIRLPTAFTPNGDGINDYFVIATSENTVIASVKIFNRWGQQVYSAENNNGWDGNYKGIAQLTGSYICFISYYQDVDPSHVLYKVGAFELFR